MRIRQLVREVERYPSVDCRVNSKITQKILSMTSYSHVINRKAVLASSISDYFRKLNGLIILFRYIRFFSYFALNFRVLAEEKNDNHFIQLLEILNGTLYHFKHSLEKMITHPK